MNSIIVLVMAASLNLQPSPSTTQPALPNTTALERKTPLVPQPRQNQPSRELIETSLDEIRDRIQPGDVIAFSGKSRVSHFIRFFSGSNVSHVGLVLEKPSATSSGLMIESTAETVLPESWHRKGANEGVRISPIEERLAEYDGTIWLLPLSEEARARADWDSFRRFLEEQERKGYDRLQVFKLIGHPLFHLPLFGYLLRNHENLHKLFCSELVAAAFRSANAVGRVNPSEVSPKGVLRFPIYAGVVFQLKGEPSPIAGDGSQYEIVSTLSASGALAAQLQVAIRDSKSRQETLEE